MRKIHFFFISIVSIIGISTLLQAQSIPIITSASSPLVGDVFNGVLVDTTGWNPGAAGANVTWDFSAWVTKTNGTVSYVAASATPYSTSFTNSNLAMNQTGYYSFYDSQLTGFYVTGTANATVVMPYSNKQTIVTFPFTYLDSLTDNAKGSFSNTYGGYTVTDIRTITSKTIADGYGTLKLPGATYNNVLRLKTVSHTIDSVWTAGVWSSTASADYTEYNWVIPGSRPFICYMNKGIQQNSIETKGIIYVQNPVVTGIQDIANVIGDIQVYPNPSNGKFTITMEDVRMGDGKIAVYNVLGERVYSATHLQITKLSNYQIDLPALPAGIYFLQVNTGEEIVNRKLVLEK